MTHFDFEALAQQLERSNDHRVLRRLVDHGEPPIDGGIYSRWGLILDVETTGLNSERDSIIELGIVPFAFDPVGSLIGHCEPAVAFLDDPGRPIPEEVFRLTGITQEMVRGMHIDDAVVVPLLERSHLIVAHHAAFDRPFVERRWPFTEKKAWACSLSEIPWRARGYTTSTLEFLVLKHCRCFFDGHRAADDCRALVRLLKTPFDSGETPFGLLLESARRTTARIWALDSPFDRKDLLKARGYRWSPGELGRPRSWFTEIDAADKAAELAWLAAAVYNGTSEHVRVDLRDARQRYRD